jgi:hypothetical protein
MDELTPRDAPVAAQIFRSISDQLCAATADVFHDPVAVPAPAAGHTGQVIREAMGIQHGRYFGGSVRCLTHIKLRRIPLSC